MILPLFFFSGATALIYEIIWSKYLALMFGGTIQAQTVVLAVYMGGLAIGNRWLGRRAGALRRPLAAYGWIELVMGVYAVCFDSLYQATDGLFVHLGRGLLSEPLRLLGLKGLLSLLLLLGPTVLMGGTLPLLATWLQKRQADPGRSSTRFYAVNSLGAVAGAALAGYCLVEKFGLVSSLRWAAAVNVMIGVTALLLSRRESETPKPKKPRNEEHQNAAAPPLALGWSAGLVALTGGVSMGLEIVASRALALVFGASSQAFAVVLIAFITGIGLGSLAVSSRRFQWHSKPGAIPLLLIGASYWIGLFVLTLERWTMFYAQAKTGFAPTDIGYVYDQLLTAAIALVVLGVPAALLGSVLPLVIRINSENAAALGDCVGRLLTWNTAGAVFGVLTAGFALMPALGLRGAFLGLALALSLAAFILSWKNRISLASAGAGFLTLALVWISLTGREQWRHVLSSGVFRMRMEEAPSDFMAQRRELIDLLFYKDGPDATVSVERPRLNNPTHETVLRVNGKPDASTLGDLSSQMLVAHLPMLAKPGAKEVFLLGFGSGITAGALLTHPIQRLTIAENCGPVLEAAKYFEPWNRGALNDPRARLFHEDGRTVLKLSQESYDVIVSEPSNPWVAGVASVFSGEYYEIASRHLKEDGLMVQWFHTYEMRDALVALVLRTFSDVFPYIEIWDSQEGDIILLGGKHPWASSPSVYAQVFAEEGPRRDLEQIGVTSPDAVWTRQVASQQTAFAIYGDGRNGLLETDRFPLLEYEAPKAFFAGAFVQGLFQFDERTWQSAFASPEKRAVLAALSDENLIPVFDRYGFSNRDLFGFLDWDRHHPSSAAAVVYEPKPFMPVIFRPVRAYPSTTEPPSDATPELRQLLEAKTLLFHEPARWKEAVDKIELVLRTEAEKPHRLEHSDWEPADYVVIAAKERLLHQDFDGAFALLELGIQRLESVNDELFYLLRLLDRSDRSAAL